jgi:hypothetical protein
MQLHVGTVAAKGKVGRSATASCRRLMETAAFIPSAKLRLRTE